MDNALYFNEKEIIKMAILVPENVTKSLDSLGRITIPKGLRDRLYLSKDSELEIFTASLDNRLCICLTKPEAQMNEEEIKTHKPTIVQVGENNEIISYGK